MQAKDRRKIAVKHCIRAQQNSAAARLTMHFGVAAALTTVFYWEVAQSERVAQIVRTRIKDVPQKKCFTAMP